MSGSKGKEAVAKRWDIDGRGAEPGLPLNGKRRG